MSGLTEDDYYDLLKGNNRGDNFSGNHYIVRRTEKKEKTNPVTKEKILLNNSVGLPNNMNEDYEMKIGKINNKRKKRNPERQVDQQLLHFFNNH